MPRQLAIIDPGINPPLEIKINFSGLNFFFMILANCLGIQDIDVIAMKTYSNRKRTNKIEIFKRIKSQKKLVVIDDLVDSGETAKIVKSMMPNSKFVTLYAKTSGKKQADLHLYDFKDSDWLVFPWEQD